MKIYDRICEITSDIIPHNWKTKIYQELEYAGYNLQNYDKYIGQKLLLVFLFGIVAFIFPFAIAPLLGWVKTNYIVLGTKEFAFKINLLLFSFLASFITIFAIFATYYYYINYRINYRKREVEKILPDFLNMVSNNINAGMSSFLAISNAARPEFGVLSEEIKIATTKSLGTESFTQSLLALNKRIKSQMLKETVYFFVNALKTGGKLVKLLDNTANDLRETQELKKEMETSTKMYVLFVLFIILIGTPLLLAISVQFLVIIAKIQAQNTVAQSSLAVGFVSSKMTLTPEIMTFAAYILLLGNSIFSSLFLGILKEGKYIEGLKFSLPIFIVSIIIFKIINTIIPAMLNFVS